ncbi:D-glycero-beta-D-manno-heptose-1,7-bisphosphate 7-phosphatase [Bordetella genomosp. 9]|uniref:D,D-heptose 1,7-bisphosphate phosphatase n=1 Tax=Bordetella genomosp. 9 TaxID=1416803 RepID=A0A261RPH4_9BORD|nr:D-glycero-beta-D-manno-heptose 1,7-bisphosphate 7-phosphatase [Bordetella genomosp. 9]OZI26811.1 D-glycero-beta-D-manno-heptose-1,7-bisphosphate 7-phosphatase [Bordetella genomosp. 9]
MKIIILDRDGVINQDSDAFVKSPDEWVALPGSLHAISRLHQAGWTVVIASNQSGLGRGLFDMRTLTAIHAKMRRELAQVGGAIDAIFLCPHLPEDNCRCRKPLPGMYEQIAERFDVDLAGVPAVGDSLRDLQACATAGCAPWLVKTGNGQKTLASGQMPAGTRVADDLAAVVDILLEESAA